MFEQEGRRQKMHMRSGRKEANTSWEIWKAGPGTMISMQRHIGHNVAPVQLATERTECCTGWAIGLIQQGTSYVLITVVALPLGRVKQPVQVADAEGVEARCWEVRTGWAMGPSLPCFS